MKNIIQFLCFSTLFCGLFIYFVSHHPHIEAVNNPDQYYNTHLMNHDASMIYQGSAEVPASLKIADNPTFPVGAEAISIADHMGNMMKNVKVTIVGAYETTAYATTYTSAFNGAVVRDHKWIVHEELIGVGTKRLSSGDQAETTAEHMKGMMHAVHTIDYSETTTVYMVDFIAKNGKQVTNHKWVIEEELLPLS